jgi:hypothetical protein
MVVLVLKLLKTEKILVSIYKLFHVINHNIKRKMHII